MPYSYNGWPASPNPDAIAINRRWEPIKGHDFPGGIKSGDVETVMTYLVRQLDSRVEPIEEYPPGDEWGYNYRANVNNPGQLSCHASGTAIDYNATQHPNKVDYTWTQAQTREIHKILDELGGVVKWLEGYDEMHFEIRGSVGQVAMVAKKIREMTAPKPPTTPTPDPTKEDDMPAGFLVKLNANKPEILQVSSAREVHWVRSSTARKGYQIQNTLDGGNDEVCTLDASNSDPNMVALRAMVVNLPFIGAMPEGYAAGWKGPHLE